MQRETTDSAHEPVAGVLFDMGGTLYSYGSRSLMGQAFGVALRRCGLDPDAPEVCEARRTASEETSRKYAVRASFLHADLFRDRLVRTAELRGVAAPDDVLDRFDTENVRAILEHMPPKPEAAPMLRALGERGIYRAIVSNADDSWLEPALRKHGIDHQLEDWTSSEEATSCKPHRRIFTYALDKAGLDGAGVLFVGDSVPHDIAGAREAGMRTVLIADNEGPTPLAAGLDTAVEPDHRIGSLSELVGIIDGLNAAR
jgi:HAD superfamily hydrolase (TIGR01509 family)